MEAALVVLAVAVFVIVAWWISAAQAPTPSLITPREDESLARGDPQLAPAIDVRARDRQSRGALARLCVLLVEDDDDLRGMLVDTLEYYGARVVAVGSAADALLRLRTEHADVLVADLRLPDQDGMTLIRALRRDHDPALARLPAASMTASHCLDDRLQALAAGFQIHMQKPVDPDHLVSAVLTLAVAPLNDGQAAL